MTKIDLVNKLMEELNLSRKEAEETVNIFLGSIIESLHNKQGVELRGFGSFRLRTRDARIGRNPKTGESVKVPPKTIVYFKTGKDLKEAINAK
jgi:integration host factor subunit beta